MRNPDRSSLLNHVWAWSFLGCWKNNRPLVISWYQVDLRLEKSIFLKQISRLNGIKYFCNNTKLVLFLPLVPPKGPWRLLFPKNCCTTTYSLSNDKHQMILFSVKLNAEHILNEHLFWYLYWIEVLSIWQHNEFLIETMFTYFSGQIICFVLKSLLSWIKGCVLPHFHEQHHDT